jgi:hypothetical protein
MRAAKDHIFVAAMPPQSRLQEAKSIPVARISREKVIFSSNFLCPGYLFNIRYVIFVEPEALLCASDHHGPQRDRRIVSRLNSSLAENSFICAGQVQ